MRYGIVFWGASDEAAHKVYLWRGKKYCVALQARVLLAGAGAAGLLFSSSFGAPLINLLPMFSIYL
jgi:hypothetical protein